MSFIDQYLPGKVPGYPCISAPRFKTTIQVSFGGNERRNQEWEHPLHKFTLPEAVARTWDVVDALGKHWRIMRGPYHSFPWRDPLDFASRDLTKPNVVPTVAAADQALGAGDGTTDTFQLTKSYIVGGEAYNRKIVLPVLSSVIVADNGVTVDPATYTVTRRADGVAGGVVQFDAPPVAGHVLTAGFLFDVEVRFEADDIFDGILRAHRAAGFADLTLVEVRPC